MNIDCKFSKTAIDQMIWRFKQIFYKIRSSIESTNARFEWKNNTYLATHWPYKRPLTIISENQILMHIITAKYDYSLIEHHFWHKYPQEFCIFIDGWFRKFAILFQESPHKRTIFVDDYQEKNLTNDSCGCHALDHVSIGRWEGFYFSKAHGIKMDAFNPSHKHIHSFCRFYEE